MFTFLWFVVLGEEGNCSANLCDLSVFHVERDVSGKQSVHVQD